MPATTSAMIVFAAMWAVILYSGFRLYRWLYRHDREVSDNRGPFEHGL